MTSTPPPSGSKGTTQQSRCNSDICQLLDRMGVPKDNRWRAVILYMRCLEHFDWLTPEQQGEVQSLVLEAMSRREFTDERFRRLVRQKEEILARPWLVKLREALAESAKLAAEFSDAARHGLGEVRSLESDTVDILREEESLEQAIERIHLRFRDTIATLEADNRRLAMLSLTDQLTGIPNRRALDEFLELSVAQAITLEGPLTFVLLDVDHFKSFNDRYGHQVGDEALCAVATLLDRYRRSLSEGFGREIMAARFGGEEFALVLPGFGLDAGMDMADEFRRSVAGFTFEVTGDKDDVVLDSGVRLTVSVGVAELSTHCPGAGPQELLAMADKAMYTAKAEGRNRTCAYSGEPPCAGEEKPAPVKTVSQPRSPNRT